MSAPKTIWIVESGQYSDYGVDGIFTSRENAQEYADYFNKDAGAWNRKEVDERELDPLISEMRKGYQSFTIFMLFDGTVESITARPLGTYPHHLHIFRRSTIAFHRGKPDALHGQVHARDQKHAIKIANDRRLALIASGEWERGS